MTHAVILAGGFGTRLRSAVSDVPKPLAPVAGKPFLDHQIAWLVRGGVTRITITAHYLAEQIFAFAAERNGHPLPIDVVKEDIPLGTGGAVKNALASIAPTGSTVIINGDTYFRFELAELTAAHEANDHPATMAVAAIDDCARYGTVTLDSGKVVQFAQATGTQAPGFVNCGAYILDDAVLDDAPDGAFSMEHDFFPALAQTGRLGAQVVEGPALSDRGDAGRQDAAFLDFGTPESYAAINRELSGR